MNKCKYTERQIYFTLEQVEKGTPIKDVCNIMGISQATFYNWRSRYGPSRVSSHPEIERLKEENKRLKMIINELENDKKILLWEFTRRR
ncbi:transposase [Pantoea sp. App145]|uniref:transposase n=1 Tax=Pantoea sp. App145 TaxID=3071567 RepID=UPI003A7F8748